MRESFSYSVKFIDSTSVFSNSEIMAAESMPEPAPGSKISKCFLVGTYNWTINFATSTSVKNWPIFFLSALEIELRNELVSSDTKFNTQNHLN